MNVSKKGKRLGEEKTNNQNSTMRVVEYNSATDIVVEFQDEYKAKVHTNYGAFLKGQVKNPYYPSVYEVGMIGIKYPVWENGKHTKEYNAWNHMLERCYSKILLKRKPTYNNVTCCNEWLLYENFYEWLHNQENFKKWSSNDKWAVDKDILIKGNKIYSPETCCLVPINVNSLFTKREAERNNLPVGISPRKNGKYYVRCSQGSDFNGKRKSKYIGNYDTPEQAFQAYKKYKESYIKQVAQEEYDKGNITKTCYEAMMKYEVEIAD